MLYQIKDFLNYAIIAFLLFPYSSIFNLKCVTMGKYSYCDSSLFSFIL